LPPKKKPDDHPPGHHGMPRAPAPINRLNIAEFSSIRQVNVSSLIVEAIGSATCDLPSLRRVDRKGGLFDGAADHEAMEHQCVIEGEGRGGHCRPQWTPHSRDRKSQVRKNQAGTLRMLALSPPSTTY
jgi:hypothetical protein